MPQRIYIFGHNAEDSGFPRPEDLRDYIKRGVFKDEGSRYRHNLIRNADIILLSREGEIFGHFCIEDRVPPTREDKKLFPPTKAVYMVRKPATLYKKRVALKDLGITRIRFGKPISEGEFWKVLKLAGELAHNRAAFEKYMGAIPDNSPIAADRLD